MLLSMICSVDDEKMRSVVVIVTETAVPHTIQRLCRVRRRPRRLESSFQHIFSLLLGRFLRDWLVSLVLGRRGILCQAAIVVVEHPPGTRSSGNVTVGRRLPSEV